MPSRVHGYNIHSKCIAIYKLKMCAYMCTLLSWKISGSKRSDGSSL